MSQSLSASQTSSNQSLNPILQAALSRLDIDLDLELARYQEQTSELLAPAALGYSQPNQAIDSTSEDFLLGQEEVENDLPAAPVFDSLLDTDLLGESTETESQTETDDRVAATPPPHNPPRNFTLTDDTETQPDSLPGNLVVIETLQVEPDDYLESSEQLLRSLTEEEQAQAPEKPRPRKNKFFTPVGAVAILLLLLSGGAVAYFVNNPSMVSALRAQRLWRVTTPTVSPTPAPTPVAVAETPVEPLGINAPNLAQQEFQELDINNLSTINPTPTPSFILPLPTLPSPSNNTLAQEPSTTPPVPVAPTPAATTLPSPEVNLGEVPTNTAQVEANAAEAQTGFYTVLINYNGDRSLAQAREFAEDAFVVQRPEGMRIQVASFTSESEAQALVQTLQQQGLKAEISRR